MSSVPKLLLWVFGYVKRNVMKSHDTNTSCGWPAWWVSVHSMVITLLPYSCVYLLIKMMTGWGNEWVCKSPYLCGQRIKCPEKWATAYYERLLWSLIGTKSLPVLSGLNALRLKHIHYITGKKLALLKWWGLSDCTNLFDYFLKSLRDLMFSACTHILCHLQVRVYECRSHIFSYFYEWTDILYNN